MKKITLYVMMCLVLSAGSVAADECLWNAAVVVGGSNSGGDGMGGLGVEVTREFGRNLEVGFHAYAQSEVSNEYKDAEGNEYHLTSGYSALLVKPKFRIGERLEIGLPLETGTGLLQYRYMGEYREDVRWTEEILDQVTHSIYSAGLEPKLFFNRHSAVSLAVGYRGTGPLRTSLADSGELNGVWGRMSYSYRF